MPERIRPYDWVVKSMEKHPSQWTWYGQDEGRLPHKTTSIRHQNGLSVVFRNVNYPLVYIMGDCMQPKDEDKLSNGDLPWDRVWFTAGCKEKFKLLREVKRHLSSRARCPSCYKDLEHG